MCEFCVKLTSDLMLNCAKNSKLNFLLLILTKLDLADDFISVRVVELACHLYAIYSGLHHLSE